MLAITLRTTRPDEAREVARQACGTVEPSALRTLLDDNKLCGR